MLVTLVLLRPDTLSVKEAMVLAHGFKRLGPSWWGEQGGVAPTPVVPKQREGHPCVASLSPPSI